MALQPEHPEDYFEHQLRSFLPTGWELVRSLEWIQRLTGMGNQIVGETDFILLIPDFGLLAIELKGGEVDLEENHWVRKLPNGRKKPITSPVKQGRELQNCVLSYLSELLPEGEKVVVGYCVALPDTYWNRPVPLCLNSATLIDRTRLESKGHLPCIEAAVSWWKDQLRKKGWKTQAFDLNERKLKAIRSMWGGNADWRRVSRSVVETADRRLLTLTEEQLWITKLLPLVPRIYIQGGPGSGKTILAQALARHLLDQGHKVLFLCFNRLLASYVAAEMKRQRPKCDQFSALTFGAWGRQMAKRVQSTEEETVTELDQLAPALWEAIDKTVPSETAIIVDEAQDLRDEWLEILETMVMCNEKIRNYAVFFDPAQQMFHPMPERLSEVPAITLPRNLRNTEKIAAAAYGAAEMPPPVCAHAGGLKVVVQRYSSLSEQQRAVIQTLSLLVEDGFNLERDVVVLSLRVHADSVLQGQSRIGGHSFRVGRLDERGIPFHTVQSFKGLESKVVLLTDVDAACRAYNPVNLLVGMSRARIVLHVFCSRESLTRLQEAEN